MEKSSTLEGSSLNLEPSSSGNSSEFLAGQLTSDRSFLVGIAEELAEIKNRMCKLFSA